MGDQPVPLKNSYSLIIYWITHLCQILGENNRANEPLGWIEVENQKHNGMHKHYC